MSKANCRAAQVYLKFNYASALLRIMPLDYRLPYWGDGAFTRYRERF